MREKLMKQNYARAFRTAAILAALLLLVSAIVIPLSLARQISDFSALEQHGQELAAQQGGEHGEHHRLEREALWKSQITPLSTTNYVILGGLALLWLALGVCCWLLVMAWLYKSAVNEGMNRSLWPILGLFTNLLAVFAFLIVRDNPRRARPTAQ